MEKKGASPPPPPEAADDFHIRIYREGGRGENCRDSLYKDVKEPADESSIFICSISVMLCVLLVGVSRKYFRPGNFLSN